MNVNIWEVDETQHWKVPIEEVENFIRALRVSGRLIGHFDDCVVERTPRGAGSSWRSGNRTSLSGQ